MGTASEARRIVGFELVNPTYPVVFIGSFAAALSAVTWNFEKKK